MSAGLRAIDVSLAAMRAMLDDWRDELGETAVPRSESVEERAAALRQRPPKLTLIQGGRDAR